MSISRRSLLQNSAAISFTSTLGLSACGKKTAVAPESGRKDISALLNSASDLLVTAYPETASSAGLDKGEFAYLKSKLTDRSTQGQEAIKRDVKNMAAQLRSAKSESLTADHALNLDVTSAIFETAVEGFDIPYGDMALLNYNWSYRPSPYVVAQNTGESEAIGDHNEKATEIASNVIGPAMDRQIAALESFAGQATSEAGIWAKKDGDAYYDWAIKAGTTTKMSADDIHEMGLTELADLHARMDPILRSVGYDTGTVGARMQALAKDKRYHFAMGDAGRAEIMSFIEGTVADIRARMPQAFETLVPGFLEVTRISPDVEAGAPGAYGGAGSIDGTKPGHFWINLRDTSMHNKFTLPDLTYHEAIPGHVWQGEYTFKQPLIRSLLAFNAYSEGWALYAQQIADELGVYDDFAVGRLGYLQSLAFRACRLVVDTGLHSKRWSREKANSWFVTANGSNAEEVAGEVDRYCAWPGQALGYKVGHSEINSLRAKAQQQLGDKFDFKRFNDAVVLGGSVPMTVLGRVIDDYIAREKA